MPGVWFDYRPDGSGGVAARIEIGAAAADIFASCILGDPLAGLQEGLARLRAAPGTVEVSWLAEPGEHRWLLTRTGGEVAIRILHLRRWSHRGGDDAGTTVLVATCSLDQLDRAVRAGASRAERHAGPAAAS